MKFLRLLRSSIRALFSHKVRAMLALISIAVGVAAVVVTGAIGEGAREEVLRKTESMGTNLLVVRPAQIKISAARKDISGVVTSLRLDDYNAIVDLPRVARAAPGVVKTLRVKAAHSSMSAMVLGTTPAYLDVCRFRVHAGRFFDDDDNLKAQRVAVLGSRVDEDLFGSDDPIGRDVRIRGVPFEVVGVLEAKGITADGSDEDNQVLIPIRTALRRVFNSTWLDPVFVSVRDPREMDEAEREIADLLRDRHHLARSGKPDDFVIQNKAKVLAAQKQIADSLSLLVIGLAGASLVVGGTGILALMLMSVKQRTGEIGLRMAVGARSRDILFQFLSEAAFLAFGGWFAGIVLSGLGAMAVALGTNWKIAVPMEAVFATFIMALIIGLGFGAYPARKASLMPPIQALLVE